MGKKCIVVERYMVYSGRKYGSSLSPAVYTAKVIIYYT